LKIALFLNHPQCSVQSINAVISALADYSFKIFTKHKVEDHFFNDVDMVCFPGGIGQADSFDSIMRNHFQPIKDFVKKGKPYLGICMGAYWADQYYFDILKETRVLQYIKQPNACTKRPHAKSICFNWQGYRSEMFFYDGCTFKGGEFRTVADYGMADLPMAIRQDNIGLIGCHPEAEEFWYDMYSYTKNRYISNATLLSQFVEDLLS